MNTMFALFRHKRLWMCGVLAAMAMAASMLTAQSLRARIAAEPSDSNFAVIPGSRQPLATPQSDVGRVPTNTQLQGVSIYFNRSAAQEADLNALLAAQQDSRSPLYHKWLTSDQFAARFGMAQADLDKVTAWLQRQGFTADSVNRSRNAIRFNGTVGQIESAFQTQIHFYEVNGEKHFAPSTALSVPAAFAPVVATVSNLSDFRPRPQHISPRAAFTSGQSGNVFLAPGDIATAYDITPLTSGGNDGTGQTIAVMGQSSVALSDIEAFQSAAGLAKKDPTLVLVPGTGTSKPFSGDQSESDLDLEWSGGTAPGATIAFVYTGSNTNYGVYDSAQYAIDQMIGTIITLSYSSCETEISPANLTVLENMFKQAAAQGQTVMAASGDQGSTACQGDTHLTNAEQTALAVNYPASSAFVTGIGGTEMSQTDASGNSTYWSSNGSSDVVNSLLKYVPEVAWNDDDPQYGLSASGGGTSTLVARPSWQKGVPGIPSGSFRLVPDISFYSSPSFPGYLYCSSDTSAWSKTQTASCNSGFRDSSSGLLTVAGGTSFATPIFAGMVAILNQTLNYPTGQGLINPTLYSLASNSATYASAFHDVTSGDNKCTAGTTYCGTTTGGFSAGTGYDEVTGLGSLDLANLAAAWPANTGSTATLIPTSVKLVAANATPAVNTDDVVTITVAPITGSTIPTGTVTLQVDGGATFGGTTVPAQNLTANGTLSYTANFSSAGPHQVLAQYSGDSLYAASTGVVAIVIPSPTAGAFALKATDVAVPRGSSGTSTITVTPSNGYTGTVNLSFSTSDNATLQNLCYSFTNQTSSGDGTVDVTGTAPVTTQLMLDTNAADCASTTGGSLPSGKHWIKLGASGGKTVAASSQPNHERGSLPAGLALAGLLLAGFMGGASRKLRSLACVIALAAAGMAVTACGSSSVNSADPPKGTYSITVTGTDSGSSTITGSTSFKFIIN